MHGLRDITFQITLSLEPYLYIFQDPLYATAYIHSVQSCFCGNTHDLASRLSYGICGISRAKRKNAVDPAGHGDSSILDQFSDSGIRLDRYP